MQVHDSRDSLSERVTKLEATTEHLGDDFKKIDTRLDKLDDIHAKTVRTEAISETILQRLITGDQQFVRILATQDAQDSRLASLEESRTHIEGRNDRPGLALLQDDYLRRKTAQRMIMKILSGISALAVILGAWFSGLSAFFHSPKP